MSRGPKMKMMGKRPDYMSQSPQGKLRRAEARRRGKGAWFDPHSVKKPNTSPSKFANYTIGVDYGQDPFSHHPGDIDKAELVAVDVRQERRDRDGNPCGPTTIIVHLFVWSKKYYNANTTFSVQSEDDHHKQKFVETERDQRGVEVPPGASLVARRINFKHAKRFARREPATMYFDIEQTAFTFLRQDEELERMFLIPDGVPIITLLPRNYFKHVTKKTR